MAAGDYVKTYAGAIRSAVGGGAAAIVRGELAAGRSLSSATEALTAAFPSLSGRIAALIAGNVSRQTSAEQRQFVSGVLPLMPAASFEPVQNLLAPVRYLAVATYANVLTGQRATVSHWIESGTPLTFAEIAAKARAKIDILSRTPRSGSDLVAAIIGLGPMAPLNVEPTIEVSRAQIRA
jgi:hypothetical protein